jgi:hypothetical protein
MFCFGGVSMSEDRKTIYIRMVKRYGALKTARHLQVSEGMTFTQAMRYVAELIKPKPLTRAEENRLIAFINNQ